MITTCMHNWVPQNSVLNSINTGFGPENSLSLQHGCSNSTVLHLYKETYLSEFETEEEKARVRLNLGVPSLAEVSRRVQLEMSNYATKADVDKVVAGTLSLQNYYTKAETDSKLKSVKLNLDTSPKQGSTNGVTSGGVWTYIDQTVGEINRYVQTI